MRFVFFYHSIISDWNNGNAHFLRGIVRTLLQDGHFVTVLEPSEGWSRTSLLREYGPGALERLSAAFPEFTPQLYDPEGLDLDSVLHEADVVLVHEWNTPKLVRDVGRKKASGAGFLLFFHDTHHRMVSQPKSAEKFDLSAYDGVLAFGEVIREMYDRRGWARRAWTWHEAADVDLFMPHDSPRDRSDLVWIGNWGDDERTDELREFLFDPVRELGLRATIYGVRYPGEALKEVLKSGAAYGGWLPNHRVPETFACHSLTVHVPRRPYAGTLPGIPTIRVFEALACGIPLICSPWDDAEGLFTPGEDFLVARNGQEMKDTIRSVLADPDLADSLAGHGRRTILGKHTCRHRVQELLSICSELAGESLIHGVCL